MMVEVVDDVASGEICSWCCRVGIDVVLVQVVKGLVCVVGSDGSAADVR